MGSMLPTVCTKGPRFPYIFLIIQEVRCLLCCHDDNTPCACALHDASAQRMRIKYFIFATTKYSIINSTASRLYGTNVIFAFGAAPPKVVGTRRGHPGE